MVVMILEGDYEMKNNYIGWGIVNLFNCWCVKL